MKYKLIAIAITTILSPQINAATYKVVELGNADTAKHSYVTDFNDSGTAIGVIRGNYNLPIDVSAIDFEDNTLENAWDNQKTYEESIDKTITFTLADIQAGTINADALSFMKTFLAGKSGDANWQKMSDPIAVSFSPLPEEQLFFDQDLSNQDVPYDYTGLSRSVNNNFTAISENGVKVGWGSAPYTKEMFTPGGETEAELFYSREFENRARVIKPDGTFFDIVPEYNQYGGISIVTDISQQADGGYVLVGEVSTGIPVDRQENLDDNCLGEDDDEEPTSVCVWKYKIQPTQLFDRRAVKWSLDADFNITNTEILGLALTIQDDEEFAFKSTALTVNSEGVSAGYSHARWKDTDTIVTMPAYYKDGEVKTFINQEDDWRGGQVADINDNNILTGYSTKPISGTTRAKFFYHDINTGQTTFPIDYFESSASLARDINNNGIIVGEGEIETNTSSNRRKEAFMYDINAEKFTNINDLLPCYDTDGETRFPYVIAEATGINEQNEIIGSATKTVVKKDSKGDTVTDTSGEIEYESIVVAVKLVPISGEVESCPTQAAETYKRKAGNFGFLSLLLLPLVALRRKFLK
ncbi:DUF3466 family protein [Pseudoalteromonas denitrificans]|uniref:GlyGly-CTERM domain-containing protein n=1 Tax=Pseudoalteromonas denitrificans DSM 6059 TaxID=1123010 RepID=A0A1I1NFB8_9GAMM|nr:DUF3466 family protein [Pseudoalteromonas denitrificans]SFC96319.1 GlyGly-CTERM domain-containing protein [Pseudoalteromonas denitrificans DSM 6059]